MKNVLFTVFKYTIVTVLTLFVLELIFWDSLDWCAIMKFLPIFGGC